MVRVRRGVDSECREQASREKAEDRAGRGFGGRLDRPRVARRRRPEAGGADGRACRASVLPAVLFVAIRRGLPACHSDGARGRGGINCFFLPPFYRLTIARSGDAVTFVVLLIAALVVGRLAATGKVTEEAELRAELASTPEQEALIVAEAASGSHPGGRASNTGSVAIASAVASMGGPDLRLAFGSEPRAGGERSRRRCQVRPGLRGSTPPPRWAGAMRSSSASRTCSRASWISELRAQVRATWKAAEAEADHRGDAADGGAHAISHDLR